jgi:hypothetical protein
MRGRDLIRGIRRSAALLLDTERMNISNCLTDVNNYFWSAIDSSSAKSKSFEPWLTRNSQRGLRPQPNRKGVALYGKVRGTVIHHHRKETRHGYVSYTSYLVRQGNAEWI